MLAESQRGFVDVTDGREGGRGACQRKKILKDTEGFPAKTRLLEMKQQFFGS